MIKLVTLPFSLALVVLTWPFMDFETMFKNKPEVANNFAVVELFTSEGCSSCPPADDALIELSKDYPANVYVLSFHVDYWDYIGWKDRFSSAAFTDRQRAYANQFKLSSIYTPEVVVNGKEEFVGSNRTKLKAAINQELKNSASATVTVNATSKTNATIEATYDLKNSSGNFVHLALVQSKAESNVKRGENSGHTLHHINVVRELKTVNDNKSSGSVTFTIPKELSAAELKVIAFVQGKNGVIVGATVATVKERRERLGRRCEVRGSSLADRRRPPIYKNVLLYLE